jgi:hypothetical protein
MRAMVDRRNGIVRSARRTADMLTVVRHVSCDTLRQAALAYIAEHTDLRASDMSEESIEDWMLRTARHGFTNYDSILTQVNSKPQHGIDYQVLRSEADLLSVRTWPVLVAAYRRSLSMGNGGNVPHRNRHAEKHRFPAMPPFADPTKGKEQS